jgi:hypothetical protein
MLFSRFGINYNNLSPMFRKGSTLVRSDPAESSSSGVGAATNLSEVPPTAVAGPASAASQRALEGLLEGQDGAAPVGEGGTMDLDALEEAPRLTEVPPKAMRAKKPKKVRPFEGLTGEVVILHEDIIGDTFWLDRTWLLA